MTGFRWPDPGGGRMRRWRGPGRPGRAGAVALSVGLATLAAPSMAETTRLPHPLFSVGWSPGELPVPGMDLAPGAPFAANAEPAPHDIPADVVVRAFAKAEEGVLRLILRVPLTSMRDVDFPVRGPGYVEIAEATEMLPDLAQLWIAGYVTLFEEGAGAGSSVNSDIALPAPAVTATRISLPSDPSFADYERALAHMSAPPLADGIDLVLEQAMLDVTLTTPVSSEDARFSIDPRWAHLGLRTTTVLRFVTPDGAERVFQYTGNPGRVRLDPRWHQAFLRFVALGFAHILDGIDHLLFLLCLVIPLRRVIPLVKVVTAFTAAHSITLGASVMGLAPNALWFPPLIEMLIAASIVFMALENIVGRTVQRRWIWAFGFGLVHGFGFSFLLRESLQFAGSHLWSSLLGFNVGVELGQLFALLIMVPALALILAKAPRPRVAGILASALVAHTSWHWMAERWTVFSAYDFRWPATGTAAGALAMRWVALAAIVLAVGWGLGALYGRWGRGKALQEPDRGGAAVAGAGNPEA